MSNLTRAVFTNSEYCVAETPLWQFDYGQQLQILGIELPDVFEAHFSNDPTGESKTQIGQGGVVAIPDEYLLNSGYLYVWVYLHTSATDGETRYQIKVKIRERATPSDTPPTPQQQDVITEAIAALNDGVTRSEAAAEAAAEAADMFPAGGMTGQILAKASNADYDTHWINNEGGGGALPSGGTDGQYLVRSSAAQEGAIWRDLPIFDGSYEVTPLPYMETIMQTQRTYLDRDIVVKEIPYAEVTNEKGGLTATIGG